MKRKLLGAIFILSMMFFILPITASAALSSVPSKLKNTSQEEWDVLRLTNIERAKEGLPLLITFNKIQKAGDVRAKELHKLYSHTRPNGSSPWSALSQVGVSHNTAAENIAKGYRTPSAVVNGWMNSPGHKKNILKPKLRYMGVGMSNQGEKGWVQLFANNNNSDSIAISFNEDKGYFTLQLANGTIAYAPYDPASSPTVNGKPTFNYPGANTAKDLGNALALDNGWYNLSLLGVPINFIDNRAVLHNGAKTAFYLENYGNYEISLKLADGRYLGLSSAKAREQAKLVNKKYRFKVIYRGEGDKFTLHPLKNLSLTLNPVGANTTNGTVINLWDGYEEFYNMTFTPTNKPNSNDTTTPKVSTALDDGWYNLSLLDVPVHFVNDMLVLQRDTNTVFYLTNYPNGEISLKLADGGYLGLKKVTGGSQGTIVNDEYRFVMKLRAGSNQFSLHPAENTEFMLNPQAGNSSNGTRIDLWYMYDKSYNFTFTPAN